ncbi:MAG: metallophosphoesterase family protein [Thermacetogeniaceae bacterium]
MRYAIISDIHANLEAFQAALEDLDRQGVQKVVCLGDIVGYYANPNECAELCRSRGFLCLRGNHDDAVVGICGIEDFNPVAQDALLWTERQLNESNKAWLKQLPEQALVDDRFLVVHGSPIHPYDYIFSPAGATFAFDALATEYPRIALCFFGHTHQRAIYSYGDRTIQEFLEHNQASAYSIHDDKLYLINPGSIGQARDGKPGASYLIYDDDSHTISYRHVPYDFHLTKQKVAAAGLPPMLAERLGLGF